MRRILHQQPAAGMSENPLSHKEVQEAADMAAPNFKRLVTEAVKGMAALA